MKTTSNTLLSNSITSDPGVGPTQDGVKFDQESIELWQAGVRTVYIPKTGSPSFIGEVTATSGSFDYLYTNAPDALTIGDGGNILLEQGGNINFTTVIPPSACTASLITAAGLLSVGNYHYKITYVNSAGETSDGDVSNTVTTDASNLQIALSSIPISTAEGVTARKIYRTIAGGSLHYYVATISNNTTTTYTDNVADASLGSDAVDIRPNTTFGKIQLDGINLINVGAYNSIIGQYAGYDNTTGISNNSLGSLSLRHNTTGYQNNCIGFNAMYTNTTGYQNNCMGDGALKTNLSGIGNIAIGTSSMYVNSTTSWNVAIGGYSLFNNVASYNTAIGNTALYSITSGASNTAIGYNAGRYITGGATANQTSGTSVYLGRDTKASASGNANEIVIGYNTTGSGSNSVTLGSTAVTKTILQGSVGVGVTPTSPMQVPGLPVYANNAAAVTGGLTVGAFYRTGADPDQVCVVH